MPASQKPPALDFTVKDDWCLCFLLTMTVADVHFYIFSVFISPGNN